MSTDVERADKFYPDDLRALSSWEDAIALLAEYGIDTVSADEVLGDGFELLTQEDKVRLVGVPMVLLEWRFTDGDHGQFASIRACVGGGKGVFRRVILNDGSTGICAQLRDLTDRKGITGGLIVAKGLVRSDYTHTDEATGKETAATTFYLSESA